jgi:parallel beta-helix repeat protein
MQSGVALRAQLTREEDAHPVKQGCLIVVILAIALIGAAQAACGGMPDTLAQSTAKRFYVSTSGSDRNSGTKAHPWRTIGHAARALRAGQTAVVLGGTYNESFNWSRGGTEAAPVTIRAAAGARVTVTGRIKIWATNVRLSGFRLLGQTTANANEVAVYVSGGGNIEISGNEITRSARSGIFVGGGATEVRIVGNWIHDNGTRDGLDHGIYVHTAADALIANNVIESNTAYGVHLYPNADDTIVTSNTIVDNGRSGIMVAGDSRASSDGNLLVNNIFAFNQEFGMRTFWSSPVGTENEARANLVYDNADGDVAPAEKARGMSYSDTWIAAPDFVDRTGSDYHLQAASPALGRAVPDWAPATDFDGRARPQGSAPDLGAFER